VVGINHIVDLEHMDLLEEELIREYNVKEIIRGAMVAEKTAQRVKEVHKQVIKEVVKIPCKYCGILIESTSTKCSGCGAPLKPF
jgi:rubrerythrin